MAASQHATDGFTLLELTLVLVVIGLIVGGILVGRDLINASQLRSVVSQIERYDAAVWAFKGKFDCLPGDCPVAVAAGLGDTSCPATYLCEDAQAILPFEFAGCNGDGNEKLGYVGERGCPENLNFWHHLSKAMLIEGQFDGRSVKHQGIQTFNYIPVFGQSSPATRLRDAGIMTQETSYLVGFDTTPTQALARLTASEAQQVDIKLDDGLPNPFEGRVGAMSITGQCYLPSPFRYNVGSEQARCAIFVQIPGFQ